MELFLHDSNSKSDTSKIYDRAFLKSTELYIVTAYLTVWDKKIKLNSQCKSFRVIIGKDFGITRKKACLDLLKWLPADRKHQFLVADHINGFHPKAIFWRENNGKNYTLIGSSNLTKAAFESNYEANIFTEISNSDFQEAKKWINNISDSSVIVSEDWLAEYKEGVNKQKKKNSSNKNSFSVIDLELPDPEDTKKVIEIRKKQLENHLKVKNKLHKLFIDCASKKISGEYFYDNLPTLWNGGNIGNRLQGSGWERSGKNSKFEEISKSFLNIYKATDLDRDDVVVQELNRLHKLKVPTRKAFFSEMLCLEFPDKYPVLNQPVYNYLKHIKFSPPKNSSEGSAYLDLAKKLRLSLKNNPDYPAKNLAQLDTVIWLKFQDNHLTKT